LDNCKLAWMFSIIFFYLHSTTVQSE
jgi:hypothetical protein